MRIYFIISLFLIGLIYGCTETTSAPTNVAIGEKCAYDTECVAGAICNPDGKVCATITSLIADNRGCKHSSECDATKCPDGGSCRCEDGVCKTYDPCNPNQCDTLYPGKNRSVCSVDATNRVLCGCDENYKEQGGECILACNDHGSPKGDGTCQCDANYTHGNDGADTTSCFYDCSAIDNSEVNSANDGCECIDGYMWETQAHAKCIVDPCVAYLQENCKTANKNRCELVEGEPTCKCNLGYKEDINGECLRLGKPCDTTMDCNAEEICTINLVENELKSFCISRDNVKKKSGFYCETNEECESGFCVIEGSSTGGYCGQLCNACAPTDCYHELKPDFQSTCKIDPVEGYTICECSFEHVQVGGNCLSLDTEGGSCGLNELVINKSGIYGGKNDLAGYQNKINSVEKCYDNQDGTLVLNSVTAMEAAETYFRLDITYESRVRIEMINETIRDSVLMIRESCEDAQYLYCINDGQFFDFHGTLDQTFAPGSYYLIVDATATGGGNTTGSFKLKVLIDEDRCPQETLCSDETVTFGEQSQSYRICKPQNDGATLCNVKADCPDGKSCNGLYCQ